MTVNQNTEHEATTLKGPSVSRRTVIVGAAASAALLAAPTTTFAKPFSTSPTKHNSEETNTMSSIALKDGNSLYYKDWGTGQPIVFSHGWPLNADAWDAQMLFFGQHGYRVIAHDRRSHGRSSQTWEGNEMDTYADDLAQLFDRLDLKNAVLIGHSTGGGEVVHYIAKHGSKRVLKAVLISAVPPIMVKSKKNPLGTPIENFDKIRAGVATNRSQFYRDLAVPFFGFNRPGADISQGTIETFWQQGMVGGIKGQYDCIKAFSETDFNDDLAKVDVSTLIMHGDDDQIVPFPDAGALTVKLVKNAKLKVYPGYPHGMPMTHSDVINKDLLAFIKE
jgi:non-heme chloroperoxidase